MDPIVVIIIVGIVAWLVIPGTGFGLIGDPIVGIIGAYVGGVLRRPSSEPLCFCASCG